MKRYDGMGLALLLGALVSLVSACDLVGNAPKAGAYARRITSPTDLIGGRAASGQIGDWLIGNDKIRVIIQDKGWSRGMGVFGGGIIDADVVRPGVTTSGQGGTGSDNYGEGFPAFFLQAFKVGDQLEVDPITGKTYTVPGIEVLQDGSDGGPAVIRARAGRGDFVTMIAKALDLAIPTRGLRYETDYILEPNSRHVIMKGRIRNLIKETQKLDGQGLNDFIANLIPGASLQLPMVDVLLFGAGNTVFAPGAVSRKGDPEHPKNIGFDIQYSLASAYATLADRGLHLPALPGLAVDFLATAGPGVSYGFAAADSDDNYAWMNREQYARDDLVVPTPHSLLVPILMSSFTGAAVVVPPSMLAPAGGPGDVYEYTRYFLVGNGDVNSIREELYTMRQEPTGTLEGIVANERGKVDTATWVHILDAAGHSYSQSQVDSNGRFRATLAPGHYHYRVTSPSMRPYPRLEDLASTAFDIVAGDSRFVYIRAPLPAELKVTVRDSDGRLLPAKVSVVGRYSADFDGQNPRDFLFDFSLGEKRRQSDLTWRDPPEQRQRQYLEAVLFGANGVVQGSARPSGDGIGPEAYDIYVSRGPEYDLVVKRDVRLPAGVLTELEAVLHRVVDTTDYVSVDMHVHTANSIDSFSPIANQITAAAAEGVEVAVATDHNVVTDYQPTAKALGLEDFFRGITGVEMTTFEMGHFNAFPLRRDMSVPTHFPLVKACVASKPDASNGAFDWVECAPGQIFDNLRALGEFGPENTIVQVNHPRDAILGYFRQFYVNTWTGVAERPDAANNAEAGLGLVPHNDDTHQFEPDHFSLGFDTIEVFNGKRMDLLHGFALPENAPADVVATKQDTCHSGHALNGPGKVVLRKGGAVAYPGGVDDWMHLLNAGHVFTAVGNSDSHFPSDELGAPRTYLYLPRTGEEPRDLHPGALEPLDIVRALHSHRAVVSNAPFLTMRVVTPTDDSGTPACASLASETTCAAQGCQWYPQAQHCLPPPRYWEMGETVLYAQSNVQRNVNVELTLRAAPWVKVKRLVLYANGKVVDTLSIPDGTVDTTIPWQHAFDRDTVLVAEARGDDSLFPLVSPKEESLAELADAVQAIAGNLAKDFSFASGDDISAPSYLRKVFPYALTNPIWLDIDASGAFDPPGNDPGPGMTSTVGCPNTLPASASARAMPLGVLFERTRRSQGSARMDVRQLFTVPVEY
jgi:hypothetical protein